MFRLLVEAVGEAENWWKESGLSSFGGARERRLASSCRQRESTPCKEPATFADWGLSLKVAWELVGTEALQVWLTASLPPHRSAADLWGLSCLYVSGPVARRRSAEAKLNALLSDVLLLLTAPGCCGCAICRMPLMGWCCGVWGSLRDPWELARGSGSTCLRFGFM